MSLEALLQEYAEAGIGERLYAELVRAVSRTVRHRRYPTSYSPSGTWDDDTFLGLAHDWAAERLLALGHLDHLLLANETLGGFRAGLEHSFAQFLIGRRKRTTLDHLFRRANTLLETDSRFALVVNTGQKGSRFWGLVDRVSAAPWNGPERELIAAGFRTPLGSVIRYRAGARRLSPLITDTALGDYLAGLLAEVGALLNLDQMLTGIRYRLGLLDATEVSLHASPTGAGEDERESLAELIADTAAGPEDQTLVAETAAAVYVELTPRQRAALRAYAEPDATLEGVARRLGCSRGTVDNELRRASAVIGRFADTDDEASAVYARLLELIEA